MAGSHSIFYRFNAPSCNKLSQVGGRVEISHAYGNLKASIIIKHFPNRTWCRRRAATVASQNGKSGRKSSTRFLEAGSPNLLSQLQPWTQLNEAKIMLENTLQRGVLGVLYSYRSELGEAGGAGLWLWPQWFLSSYNKIESQIRIKFKKETTGKFWSS